jgi:pyruvate kinase
METRGRAEWKSEKSETRDQGKAESNKNFPMSFAKIPSDLFTSILGDSAVAPRQRGTKLMATIGPSSRSVDILKQMLLSGMQLARFDFAWSPSADYHQESLENLRIAIKQTGIECSIVLETAGREILVLNRPSAAIDLTAGQQIVLSCDKTLKASSSLLPLSTLNTFHGHGLVCGSSQIYLGQYLVTGSERSSSVLTVQSISDDGKSLTCSVVNSCSLDGEQIVVNAFFSAPGPSLTPDDVSTIKAWGKKNEIDFLSIAFTHCKEDVQEARALLDSVGLNKTKIFGKIETVEGLHSLEAILDVVDGVIFSRGNLGVSLNQPEKMFRVQKEVLNRCNLRGRPVFVSRVVDSMENAPRPTRAEATGEPLVLE